MFKSIKSLFIVEEEGNKSSSKSSTKTPPKPSNKTAPIKSESITGEPGKVTSKFMDVLFASMEQNNLEGFDYLEYKQSLQSLKKMPMDEATRYKSAYAMAQTMGATPANLVQTAQHYLHILEKEEKKFEKAVSNQVNTQIGSKKNEIKGLDETIKAKADQIQKLTQEIDNHQKQKEGLQKEISQASVKVETTKNNFIASYNTLVSQIQGDIDRIKQYLLGETK